MRLPCASARVYGAASIGRRRRQRPVLVVVVERKTRYLILAKVNNKDTEIAINALVTHAQQLPKELYASLTWNRGTEMADHQRFTLATDIKVYFCDPHNPWQRGSNENTNGLLRQYFPKGNGYRTRGMRFPSFRARMPARRRGN
jgi:IS30 family transposase